MEKIKFMDEETGRFLSRIYFSLPDDEGRQQEKDDQEGHAAEGRRGDGNPAPAALAAGAQNEDGNKKSNNCQRRIKMLKQVIEHGMRGKLG